MSKAIRSVKSVCSIQEGFKKEQEGSAQSNTLCGQVKDGNDAIMKLVAEVLENNSIDIVVRSIIEVLAVNGCRISEVLAIKSTDILGDNTIRIRGLKGSSDRVVFVFKSANYITECKKNGISPFAQISRFQVYRELKKLGIYEVFGNNINASTTHIFRHLYVKKLLASGVRIEDVQKIIGHKSVENTKIYAK